MRGLLKIRNIMSRFSNENKSETSANRFKKYILYAIGEIILIVIGILFALYLNNLNEIKKLKTIEIKVLKEIQTSLANSKDKFDYVLETEKRYLQYNYMIHYYLDNKKPYSDSLDIAFGTYYWTISSTPITSGYEYLKSIGLDMIKNDTLREKISFMFESDIKIIEADNEKWSNNLQLMISLPYHVEHFEKYFHHESKPGDDEYAKPTDYNFLLNDVKFKNINAEIISTRRWSILGYQEIIIRIDSLRSEIKREVYRLNKK